jgi:uncharacterized protein YjdB
MPSYPSTQQLTVVLRDSNSNILAPRTTTYESSDTAVATVSAGGLVTAVGIGSCTITATCEGKTDSSPVVVNENT